MSHSEEQAQAQYESLVDLVERMQSGEERALEEIHEDALSVLVRSDWEDSPEKFKAAEYEILLCTGGPAVRIIGDLDEGSPTSARLQHQDWFTAFWLVLPLRSLRTLQDWSEADEKILLSYANCFYFGE